MHLESGSITLTNLQDIQRNLSPPELIEELIKNGEGHLAHQGPIVTRTGEYTGRSPKDKFLVTSPGLSDKIWWKETKPLAPEQYARLRDRQLAYLQGRRVYVTDCYAGAAPRYRLPVRIITERAWHSMFARNMFIEESDPARLASFEPEFTVVHTPAFQAVPALDGTRSEVFIVIDFASRNVHIGGTSYAGEIKKSIFTILNYVLPLQGVLGMHCSANVGREGDTALFFGLSGTGKTTLSADPERSLIGDDEHGWSDEGVFNFEGGCYAKVINLSPQAEPEIYATTRTFGTILENVVFRPGSRHLDLADASFTENTRASYPLTSIPNIVRSGCGGHPRNMVFLTCDAFGVLPPIARLTSAQAMYHFISGYTAKVAGTERGVKEPVATFSACFGAPFMPLQPTVYAALLGERIARHGVDCWLVNTGWSGGPYGTGSRMKIEHSRALIRAALDGRLRDVPTRPDPVFGIGIPSSCPGVSASVLQPRTTWQDPAAYDQKAAELAAMFQKNFAAYSEVASEEVRAAGPRGGKWQA